MSETLSLPTQLRPENVTEWSDHVKELALELYYTDAGRNVMTLAKIIAAEPHNHPVPYSTLTYWKRSYLWDIEADKRADAFAPNIRHRTAGNLTVAALGMSAYLAQVASGAAEPTKPMLLAAKITLDAAGFASSRVTLDQPTTTPTSSLDIRTLTDSELRDMEHGHHTPLTPPHDPPR